MSAPVIRVCQPGFDVRSCPDWAYLFNSGWPSLAITFDVIIPSSVTLPYTITHNLGFVPLVIGWNNFGTTSYGRVSSAAFEVTTTTIRVLQLNGTSLTVRCFNVDITKDVSYPLPQSAQAKLPYNNNFGIKFAKPGKLITSNNLDDFILHSRAQSPAVLDVATEKGKYFTNSNPGSQFTGPWIVYPLRTAYIPWIVAAFLKSSSPVKYQYASINGIQLINNNLVFPLAGLNGGSLVVLRDPLFYPNTVRVVY